MDVDQTYQTTSSDDESSDQEHLEDLKRSLFEDWGINNDSDEEIGEEEAVESENSSDANDIGKEEADESEDSSDANNDSDGDVSIDESTRSDETEVRSNVLSGQQSNEANTFAIESSEVQKYKVVNVFSGSDYDSFAFLPWKIHNDESSKAHAWIRREISECLSVELTLSHVFSPFYNPSFQLLDGLLVVNDFYWASFQRIVGIDRNWLLNCTEAMHFMAYFVNDFVLNYGVNCLKHELLQSGTALEEVRRHMSDGNGQIPQMVAMLCANVDRNEIDEDTELGLLQSSTYDFQYNSVRKIMKQLVDAHMKKKPAANRGEDDKIPITSSLVSVGREDLLSIFYFAYHHYSLFREEYVDLMKTKHILLPQLMCEQMGKMLVIQRLVYPDIEYRGPWMSHLESFDEGTYTSHFFCPFALYPTLDKFHRIWYEDDACPSYDDTRQKIFIMEDLISLTHSFEMMYWHDCFYTIKNMCKEDIERRTIRESLKEIDEDVMVEDCKESDKGKPVENNEGRGKNEDTKEYDPYFMSFGDTKTPGFYEDEYRMYVMHYNVNCLPKMEDVENLKELRITDVENQYRV